MSKGNSRERFGALVLGILQMGVQFFMLGLFLKNRGLFDAFGVREVSVCLEDSDNPDNEKLVPRIRVL